MRAMEKQSNLVVLADDESEGRSNHTADMHSLYLKLKYFTLDPEERMLAQRQVLTIFKKKSKTAQNHDNACNTQESNIEDKEDTELNNHSEYNRLVKRNPDVEFDENFPEKRSDVHNPRAIVG